MNNQIEILYEQIRNQQISQQEAIAKIQKLKGRFKEGISKSISPDSYNYTIDKGDEKSRLFEDITSDLINITSSILKVEKENIDPKAIFSEYGMDRHELIELIGSVNEKYKVSLLPSFFLEYHNLESLTKYICKNYKGQITEPFVSDEKETDGSGSLDVTLPGTKKEELEILTILKKKTIDYLKALLSETLKIPIHRIEADSLMERYGVDSVKIMQMTRQLEKSFGTLSKTLFFEYQNIEELSQYFLEVYSDKLIKLLNVDNSIIKKSEDVPKAFVPEKPAIVENVQNRFLDKKSFGEKNEALLSSDIAIIGVSGTYPMSNNLNEFWENLKNGVDCITEVPADRWDYSRYFDENKNRQDKTYCKWGGFINGVDLFDPLFFNISPREAELMDPQQRLFLMTIWDLIESSGYTRDLLRNQYQSKIGVFAGAMYQQYNLFDSDVISESVTSLSSYNSIANRVSYFFNFKGPSVAVDSMCSSSLAAIHLACSSLRNKECKLAIAGGINLSIHPKKYIGLSLSKMIGSNPDSRSFGDGDGYLPAEGVGAVLLKPLLDARQDGDRILAVIKSTAINHGGLTNGFSVPNPNAQAQLIEDNLLKADIDPRTISYVEAAANGSALGDPIEIAALNNAFRKYTPDVNFCSIGSVKSNIGHAEAASGIAQLTKVVLQLQHKKLVPSIKAEPLNPHLTFDDSPFYLQRTLMDWKKPVIEINGFEQEYPRRAAINSFGAGGTNVHLIVEEYSYPESKIMTNPSCNSPQLIVFSAQSEESLCTMASQMLNYIDSVEHFSLKDVAYTLQIKKEEMEYRLGLVVHDKDELRAGILSYLKSGNIDGEEMENSMHFYSGNIDNVDVDMAAFLSGNTGEEMASLLLTEKNLEKLAILWIMGVKIPFDKLHDNETANWVLLPLYPFSKRRCWIDFNNEQSTTKDNYQEPKGIREQVNQVDVKLESKILDILSHLLGMKSEEIKSHKGLVYYGMDSILSMQLFQELQSQVDQKITINELSGCNTAQDIINVFLQSVDTTTKNVAELAQVPSIHKQGIFSKSSWAEFPELVYLNQGTEGKPVFWFHAALGGVQVYKDLAQKSNRPFYGIQARGWMTNRAPLDGLQAIASYYVHIIKTVCPEGPYDFGGYSLGGIIAYEVTRQLQELGHQVNTIVMLDTVYNPQLKMGKLPMKTSILQAVNMSLLSTIDPNSDSISKTLIHRDNLNFDLDDDLFLKELVNIAHSRGITKNISQLHTVIQQNVKVQNAYNIDDYTVLPLSFPNDVSCYYFRNGSGHFLGEMEPYYTIKAPEKSFDYMNYWELWEKHLPLLHIIDVDSSNHMTMLSQPKVADTVFDFCELLYSAKEVKTEEIQSLKDKTLSIHGSKNFEEVIW